MTKRHYIKLAEILGKRYLRLPSGLIQELGEVLFDDNKNFDYLKFIEAIKEESKRRLD